MLRRDTDFRICEVCEASHRHGEDCFAPQPRRYSDAEIIHAWKNAKYTGVPLSSQVVQRPGEGFVRVPDPAEGVLRVTSLVKLNGVVYVFPVDIFGEAVYDGNKFLGMCSALYRAVHSKMKELKHGRHGDPETVKAYEEIAAKVAEKGLMDEPA